MTAVATCAIQKGELLRSVRPPQVRRAQPPSRLLISFDGGARTRVEDDRVDDGEDPVAGAGVPVWSEPDSQGRRRCIAELAISLPRLRSSMLAEAAGLAYGLLSFAELTTGTYLGQINVHGDNLAVIRVAAGNARTRSDRTWTEMEHALMLVAREQWSEQYHAVRRHLNGKADALATTGVGLAIRKLLTQDLNDYVRIWCDHDELKKRGWARPRSLTYRPKTKLYYHINPIC